MSIQWWAPCMIKDDISFWIFKIESISEFSFVIYISLRRRSSCIFYRCMRQYYILSSRRCLNPTPKTSEDIFLGSFTLRNSK